MQIEIGQKVNHKTLGAGEVMDIYEHENGDTYIDVHFDSDNDGSRYAKYKVSTFNLKNVDTWFVQE